MKFYKIYDNIPKINKLKRYLLMQNFMKNQKILIKKIIKYFKT